MGPAGSHWDVSEYVFFILRLELQVSIQSIGQVLECNIPAGKTQAVSGIAPLFLLSSWKSGSDLLQLFGFWVFWVGFFLHTTH